MWAEAKQEAGKRQAKSNEPLSAKTAARKIDLSRPPTKVLETSLSIAIARVSQRENCIPDGSDFDFPAERPTPDKIRRQTAPKTVGHLRVVRTALSLSLFGGYAHLRDLYLWLAAQADWADVGPYQRGVVQTTNQAAADGTGALRQTTRTRLARLVRLGLVAVQGQHGRGGGITVTILDYEKNFGCGGVHTLDAPRKPRRRRPRGGGGGEVHTLDAGLPLYSKKASIPPIAPLEGGPSQEGALLEQSARFQAARIEAGQRRRRQRRARVLAAEAFTVPPVRWSPLLCAAVAALYGNALEGEIALRQAARSGLAPAQKRLRETLDGWLERAAPPEVLPKLGRPPKLPLENPQEPEKLPC